MFSYPIPQIEAAGCMRDLPVSQRPREKLLREGPQTLNDAELVAVLLGSGTAGRSALQVARELVARSDLARIPPQELRRTPGVGPARAASLAAGIELGRRLAFPAGPLVETPEDACELVADMADLDREHFRALYLDARRRMLACETISVGTLTASLVHPREVFRPALRLAAASLVVAHNHPSGDPTPSAEDAALTRRLRRAGEILGIELVDHVIIGRWGFVSLKELGEF